MHLRYRIHGSRLRTGVTFCIMPQRLLGQRTMRNRVVRVRARLALGRLLDCATRLSRKLQRRRDLRRAHGCVRVQHRLCGSFLRHAAVSAQLFWTRLVCQWCVCVCHRLHGIGLRSPAVPLGMLWKRIMQSCGWNVHLLHRLQQRRLFSSRMPEQLLGSRLLRSPRKLAVRTVAMHVSIWICRRRLSASLRGCLHRHARQRCGRAGRLL
jgi:hypothetical protein